MFFIVRYTGKKFLNVSPIIFNMMMLISIILKTLPGCHPQLEAIKEEKRNEQKPKNELPVNLKRVKENYVKIKRVKISEEETLII